MRAPSHSLQLNFDIEICNFAGTCAPDPRQRRRLWWWSFALANARTHTHARFSRRLVAVCLRACACQPNIITNTLSQLPSSSRNAASHAHTHTPHHEYKVVVQCVRCAFAEQWLCWSDCCTRVTLRMRHSARNTPKRALESWRRVQLRCVLLRPRSCWGNLISAYNNKRSRMCTQILQS